MPLLHEVAHLAHAELLTPEPERSLWFFTDVLGPQADGGSDLGHPAHRAARGQRGSLQRRVAAIEAAGLGIGWQDGDAGIGPTYLFCDPDGHEPELYFETERYQPAGAAKPALKNQAQAYPGRGAGVRRLDHVNFLAAHSEPNGRFVCEALGGRVTEQIVLDDGTISARSATRSGCCGARSGRPGDVRRAGAPSVSQRPRT
jgi:catechol 2,3-dioxygenase